MSRRAAVLIACGLAVFIVAAYFSGGNFPVTPPFTGAEAVRVPSSEIWSMPEYTKDQVVSIRYNASGTAGESGLFWTELEYKSSSMSDWALYAPPFNPSGEWFGQLGFQPNTVNGTIPFDTYYTGGEDHYDFYTIAVDRGYWSEPGPDATHPAKAATTLDTRPPQLFIATPTPDAWTNAKVVRWAATDAVSGVAGVSVQLDSAAPMSFSDAAGETAMALQAAGDHTVVVTATDRAGNAAQVWVPFHYDPVAPSLDITAPAPDSFVNTKDVDVTWTAQDAGAGIASLRLSVDSNPPVDLAGDVTSYSLTSLAERGHVLSLLAADGAGNIATESISFGVDVTPPTLTVLEPTSAYVTSKDLHVMWLGSDATSGIDHYELSLDGAAAVKLNDAAGFTFPSVGEAAHTLLITAVDRAGNAAQKSTQVTVDATPPVVSVSSPTSGSTVYGSLQVAWNASDSGSGLSTVELIYDGGSPTVATGTTTKPIASPAVGPHFVTVRVSDRAGNVAEASVPFMYGGATPPSTQGISALDFSLLMIILGAVAVAAAYVAVRRRKARSD